MPIDPKKLQKLKNITSSINKVVKGAEIWYLGSSDNTNIVRLKQSNGALSDAMGGGLPIGRIVEYYGGESSGKCLTEDTYIMGLNGLMTIKELFNYCGFETTTSSKVVGYEYPLVSENGELEKTTAFTWNDKRPVSHIKTNGGLEIKSTMNHPLRVINDKGMVVWKHTQDVVVGDYILVQKNMQNNPPKNGFDEEDGILVALLLTESHTNKNRIAFANQNHGLLKEFENLMSKKFGCNNFKEYLQLSTNGNITTNIHVNVKKIIEAVYERYRIQPVNSGEKTIPLCIRSAPLKVQKAFLRTFFQCEGSVSNGKNDGSEIEMSSKSYEMIKQVQLMALNIGSFGKIYEKPVEGEMYWRLDLSGEDARNWEKEIIPSTYFPNKIVKECNDQDLGIPNSSWIARMLLDDCINPDRGLHDILRDSASGKCNFTRNKFYDLKNSNKYEFGITGKSLYQYIENFWLNGWDFDIVKSVDVLEKVPTFDVSKPNHTFWSNGLVSHNTTQALHDIADFQRQFPDGIAAFIDSEHSFESGYAQKLGVNTDELIFQQPDTGEDALNVIQNLLANGVQMIVVDSVAAMTPKAEREKAFGDKTMGEGARMMSNAMKQLVADVSKNNAILIFTNQVRDKIGVMFGEKSTTPGGKALKFYASIRVQMISMGMEKEGDVPVGGKVKAIIKKNKTFPPMRTAEYCITYGIGVDKVIEQFNDAIDYGIIAKSGSWFSFEGSKIGQGKPTAMKLLRENKEVLAKIVAEIEKAKAEGRPKVKAAKDATKDIKKKKVIANASNEEDEANPEEADGENVENSEEVEVSDI